MNIDWFRIDKAEAELRKQLEAETGSMWKDVLIETQANHLELAIWILLYNDISLEEVNRKFYEIIIPFQSSLNPLKPTVGYYLSDGENYSYAGIFEGWKRIEKGHGYLGTWVLSGKKHPIDDIDTWVLGGEKYPIDDSWGFRSKTSSREDP